MAQMLWPSSIWRQLLTWIIPQLIGVRHEKEIRIAYKFRLFSRSNIYEEYEKQTLTVASSVSNDYLNLLLPTLEQFKKSRFHKKRYNPLKGNIRFLNQRT